MKISTGMKILTSGLDRMDWKMLRRQKSALCGIKARTKQEEDAIEGILNMIDWIQDSAHSMGYKVYPKGK